MAPLPTLRGRAAVLWSVGSPLRVHESVSFHVSEKSLPPRSAVVEVLGSGLCHTDLAVQQGHIPTRTPIVLGHEGVGIVRAYSGLDGYVAPGDLVLMGYTYCGSCLSCRRGRFSYCSKHRVVNFEGRFTDETGADYMEIQEGSRVNGSFFGQSAFASFAVATPKNLVKLGLTEADIGGRIGFGRLLSLAALTCGVQTGSGTVWNVLRPQKQSSIAVFGCGAVGLSAIMASKISGCERIIAVDKNADRLKVALELGATEISIPERFASRVSGADQQLDYAVDTTGVPEVLEKGFLGLRTGGSAVLLGGSPAGSEIKIPMLNLLLGRSIKGVIQGEAVSQDHIAKLIEHNLQGDFPFEKMIRVYKGLDKIDEAFADSKSGAVIKPIITINP